MPARPTCPDCHKQLRVKTFEERRWRYCEDCGWDERGRFEVTVWDHEGDIVKKLWEASLTEANDVLAEYDTDPRYSVVMEQLPQNELPPRT